MTTFIHGIFFESSNLKKPVNPIVQIQSWWANPAQINSTEDELSCIAAAMPIYLLY